MTNDTDLLERAHTDIMRVYSSVSVPDYLLIATWDHVTALNSRQTLKARSCVCVCVCVCVYVCVCVFVCVSRDS